MKKLIIILLLASILIVSGCSSGSNTQVSNFRTGTEGLSLSFLPYSPPPTVYSGDNVDVVIQLENKGAYDIRGGKLHLTGFDKNILGIYENYYVFDEILGKSEYSLEGEKKIIDKYTNVGVNLPDTVNSHTTPIEAIACYEYQTIASFPVCIDPNPRVNKHDGCSATDFSGNSQGGPIAVKNVQVESGLGRMRFIIDIENVGNGDLIDYNACPFGYKYNDINNINSYQVEIPGLNLNCEPDSRSLKINEAGQGRIYCQVENLNQEQSAYQSVMSITLDYDYKDSTSTSIQIRGDI
ncbi:MAG: hypothetical protein KAQ83_01405 [Nanoarchaeota archaeon]|nr:hypothetical protein [Nanoarchaeota archaeon]